MAVDADKERARLIDHFKRVYAIIAGLAITEAVKRIPLVDNLLYDPVLWLFLTFFITIVPIFHGGDRSLDLKYLDKSQPAGRPRIAYLWDVYMLLVTALLFVAMAEAIPKPDEHALRNFVTAQGTGTFYVVAAITLGFDVFILLVDRWKSEPTIKDLLVPYSWWIGFNSVLAAFCIVAAIAAAYADGAGGLVVGSTRIDLFFMFPLIAFVALMRTVGDYIVGSKFLFP